MHTTEILIEKQKRQQELVKLLKSLPFSNQQEIVSELQARGYSVTQPSISRDFRELGVAKVGGRYEVASALRLMPPTSTFTREMIAGVENAGSNLVVIRTSTGAANVVGFALDSAAVGGVIGTIAGDDTLFVAVRDKKSQQRLVQWAKNFNV